MADKIILYNTKDFAPQEYVKVVHGRWIENIEEVQGLRWMVSRCSCCNSAKPMRLLYEPLEFNYCPNCGARMDAQIGEDKSHPFAESVMMGMDEVEE